VKKNANIMKLLSSYFLHCSLLIFSWSKYFPRHFLLKHSILRSPVSYPYETLSKFIILYILIVRFSIQSGRNRLV
jgi:hypothetical protein